MSYALSEARTFRKNRKKKKKKTIPILKNKGMRSMQDLFFLAGWVEMGQFVVLNVFVFVNEKSITFKKRKYRRDRKNLIYLNSHRYYVIYCLYCLNNSKLKWWSELFERS